MAKIYVLHENNDWVVPLRKAFAERNLPFAEWYLDQWAVDLGSAPPRGRVLQPDERVVAQRATIAIRRN